jgi:WD40 repeat protein
LPRALGDSPNCAKQYRLWQRQMALAFSPDGRTLASGSPDKTVKFWDTASGQPLRTLTHNDYVHSVAFSPDGRTLASGSDDNTIKLWDVSNMNEASK